MRKALTVVKIGVILIAWFIFLWQFSEALQYTVNHMPYSITCVIETAHLSLCLLTK